MPDSASEHKVESYLHSAVLTFTEGKDEVSEALALITEHIGNPHASLSFRLLAMRRYLRIGGYRVVTQWAWTAEETEMHRTSGAARELYDLANRTTEIFAQSNPGFHLSISPLRDLERQVALWVSNESVKNAGARLLGQIRELLAAANYPDAPGGNATDRFRSALRTARVQPEPTSAAPGLSDHGQGSAVDFVVMRGKRPVASTKTSQIRTQWKGHGWEDRLISAIERCNQEQLKKPTRPAPQLSGPLQHPYEPWHWVLKYAEPRA